MAYQQKDNSGSLFINDKKQTQTQPDFKGSIMVKGVEFWISGWNNTSAKGVKYMSLSVTDKEMKDDFKASDFPTAGEYTPPGNVGMPPAPSDELPF